MAELCSQQECTSCLACYNACPFGAITLTKTSLSAISPQIQHDKCKECGLCEKSCPILSGTTFRYPSAAVALYCKNEHDKQTCSSGGLATTISRYIISKGGVVYGATSSGGYPTFRRVTYEADLELLKGSKYVYCNPELIYRAVKEDLKAGKECLFIGLPCNVAGLKKFLMKDYENLHTMDLVCHGTPPFEFLKAHLESKIGKSNGTWNLITFRGQYDFYTSVFDENKKKLYSCNQYEDAYFVGFERGLLFRPCCYECKYARPERVSDITAGDFWGLGNDALSGYKGKVSLALINTSRGNCLFEAFKDQFNWEQRTVEEAIKGNKQLNKPTEFTPAARQFQKIYSQTRSLEKAFDACGISSIISRNCIRRIILAFPKFVIRLIKR